MTITTGTLKISPASDGIFVECIIAAVDPSEEVLSIKVHLPDENLPVRELHALAAQRALEILQGHVEALRLAKA